ncbi:hypothetical protein [Micromonospora sp. RTP1Z1]|uniref:hypothetical protein n=1 Tax=Micromonospora sp. RTP1Z1 TaxID=2994043 RepID=UPI0029C76613|nr:hypothetical protein [Micromonospora sp. RTP1Z1]
MTDPHHTQQPEQPYQQGAPAYPPQQYQPAGPVQPPAHTPPAPAASPNRKQIIVAVAAAVAVLMLTAAGLAVYEGFIKEDSGVAACKAMRDGKKMDGSPKASGDDKLTEKEYRAARKVFEDSRYADIREHGTGLVDIAWQVQQLGDGQEMGALAFIGPMGTHVSGLQTACANQGVIVNLNKK